MTLFLFNFKTAISRCPIRMGCRPCVMSCNQRNREAGDVDLDPVCAWRCVPPLHYFHVLFTIDWMRAHRIPNEPNTFDTWIQTMVDDDGESPSSHWQTYNRKRPHYAGASDFHWVISFNTDCIVRHSVAPTHSQLPTAVAGRIDDAMHFSSHIRHDTKNTLIFKA